jgi:hypothetical protein
MKNRFAILTLCAGTIVCGALAVSAAPLQRADVPADPAWVLHLDCDKLRSSAVGQYMLGEMAKPEAEAKLAAFQTIFNFDLRTQVHGLTLFSTGTAPQDGVLVVYADFDSSRLIGLVEAANDYQTNSHNQHVIHNWIDERKPALDGVHPRTYAAFEGGRIIFGQREGPVANALDVLDRKAPNLSSTRNFPQLGAAGNSSFIQAAARKMDLSDAAPGAAIFRMAKGIRLDIGEAQQQMTAALTLQANDEETATNMAAIGQGLVALMKSQPEKPESVKFAEALSLNQRGAEVVARLSLPATNVVAMMRAGALRKAKQDEGK